MRLALAQTASEPGDIVANVARHAGAVEDAHTAGASVVVFPELSLTGYELPLIASDATLRLSPDDERLRPLQEACARTNVTAVAGAPVVAGGRLLLAALLLRPDGAISIYGKRNLFGDEGKIFDLGAGPVTFDCRDGTRLALGVCADIGDDEQAREACAGGADAWILPLLTSPTGYPGDVARALRAATRTGMTVAFANHAAPTGGWPTAGGSGAWYGDGTSIVAKTGEQLMTVVISPIGSDRPISPAPGPS